MWTYNDMLLARQRYEDLNKVKGRAEIEPATVTVNVLANAISAVKAAFAPTARRTSHAAHTSRSTVRRTLAAE